MSNINENRIDVILTNDAINAINESIGEIVAQLPTNTSLSDDQRNQYTSIDVENRIFCQQALTEAKDTGAGIIASYI